MRLIIAKFIPELLELSNKIKNNNDIRIIILRVYIKLLQDPEGEVRNISSKKLDVTSEYMGKEESFDKVLTCLKSLKTDCYHMLGFHLLI